ncbi:MULTISPECIES: ScbR family autoregulator-binding transcription factor [unclassified Streptomyces]|uniref:ScbR family autoregulator-binding transcription factor n=1 Tax=unclassified Streptomyces TaxID=2593676 RepID=UPI002E301621|nr:MULTISPECIES: ScbR family autoregulator-binding transcription factor [unclassified Streptomyces]WUC69128.1 TetR/AcrR family transcriptional regulator [Streptomyces sp. NBC_00539]
MDKQERATRTRESLVRAAAEVFAEEGFAAASVATISRRAGVTTGGFHFHFAGKAALARAVEDRSVEAVRRIIDAAREAGEVAADPLRVLLDSTSALMTLLAEDVVVRAGFGLSADVSRGGRVDVWGSWRLWVDELLEAAERGGILAEGVSRRDAARAVVASTVGLELMGAAEPEWVGPETLARIWTLMLGGQAST